jgi:hypothetical protein
LLGFELVILMALLGLMKGIGLVPPGLLEGVPTAEEGC